MNAALIAAYLAGVHDAYAWCVLVGSVGFLMGYWLRDWWAVRERRRWTQSVEAERDVA